MKKLIIIIGMILIYTFMFSSSKISGSLKIQIRLKQDYSAGKYKDVPEFIKHCKSIENQLVYLHFEKKPTSKQLALLSDLGVKYNIKEWVPKMKNHPTGFLTAKIPSSLKLLNRLAELNFIKFINTAEHRINQHLDIVATDIGVANVWTNDNVNGEGTKIAVIDSGFELDHPDLPTPLTAIDYSEYEPTVPDSDFTVSNENTGTFHGTYVAGSIVGQGNLSGGRWKGVAYGADWMGFKVAVDGGVPGSLSESAIMHSLRAARFYYNADFINCSFGGWDEFHDGSDEMDQLVDYISQDGACVFVSTGNEADDNRHFMGTLTGGQNSQLIKVINRDTSRGHFIFNLVWYDSPDTTIERPMTLQFYNSHGNPITLQNIEDMTQSPRGTQSRYASCTSVASYFYIQVSNLSGETLTYHLFSEFNNCDFENPETSYTISSPSTADLAFSIGSHTTRMEWTNYNGEHYVSTVGTLNDLSVFSSRGPRADGFFKPFITAPGKMVVSLLDHDDVGDAPFGSWHAFVMSNSGEGGGLPADYMLASGTSISCPITCGAAALLKSYYPAITREEIWEKLMTNARTDSYTETTPNHYWGYGKLDIEASMNALKTELKPTPPQNVTITKSSDMLMLSWDPVVNSVTGRPINVSYYKILTFTEPYTPVTENIYQTSNTYYYFVPGSDKKFFKIVAVYR